MLLYHFTFRGNNGGKLLESWPDTVTIVTKYGYLGVDLFFVISGYVIAFSAIGRTPRQFLASRISRLYPAYVSGALFTTLIVLGARPEWRDIPSPTQVLAHLTMVPNILGQDYIEPVYWTLWNEIRFYAIVLVLVAVRPTLNAFLYLSATWLTALSAYWLLKEDLPIASAADQMLQPHYGHYFVAGIVLASMRRGHRVIACRALFVWAIALAVYAAADFAEAIQVSHHVEMNSHIAGTMAALLCVIVGLLTSPKLPTPSHRATEWLTRLGGTTYPLYLVHASLGYIVINVLAPWIGAAIATAVASTLAMTVAWIVNRGIEQPLAPLIRRALMADLSVRPGARS